MPLVSAQSRRHGVVALGLVAVVAIARPAAAQTRPLASVPYGGTASVTITRPGADPKKYNFPPDLGSDYVAVQRGTGIGLFTDLGVSHTFEEQGNASVQLVMRITPAGTGTFLIHRPGTNDNPPKRFEVTVVLNGGGLDDLGEGSSGSAIITHYGGVGDYITGTFSATLRSSGTGSAQVAGTFKIVRTQ